MKPREDINKEKGNYEGKRKSKYGRPSNGTPIKMTPNDSLKTSRYAGPFRKPKNLTDSLGTASPVARKYRKLGGK
jgi:hypothetical protein